MGIEIVFGAYEKHFAGMQFDLILTSPPYNIGSKCLKKIGGRRFINGVQQGYDTKNFSAITGYPDKLPEDQYQLKQINFLKWAAMHLAPNGCIAYNHMLRHEDNRTIHPLEWIVKVPELEIFQEIVWNRGSTHNHCKYFLTPTTERIWILKRIGEKQYINKHAVPKSFRSEVWRINKEHNSEHCAQMPLSLAEIIINVFCPLNGKICDPYAGVGTTLLAAQNLGRQAIGSEIERKYFIKARERLTNGMERK